jgi:two-component system sensor histidine kinase YesM
LQGKNRLSAGFGGFMREAQQTAMRGENAPDKMPERINAGNIKTAGSMIFSHRVILVYTVIVITPLVILMFFATDILRRGEYEKVVERVTKEMEINARQVSASIETVNHVKDSIIVNPTLVRHLLFTHPDKRWPVIEQTLDIAGEIERLHLGFPLLYGIRIFVTDSRLPERWPVLFHEEKIRPPKKGIEWEYNYIETLKTGIESRVQPVVSCLGDLFLINQRVGSLQIMIPMTSFFPFLYGNDEVRNFIFSPNGVISDGYRDEKALLPVEAKIREKAKQSANGVLQFSENGKRYVFLWRLVPNSDLILVHDSSDETALNDIEYFTMLTVLGMLGSLVLLFCVISLATQKLFSRLYRVMKGMMEIEKGNYDIELKVEGNDEIAEMALVFSNMVSRIKEQIRIITQEQRLVAETEIKAMQNQINAHFLYNILETVKMQAEVHNTDTIVRIITLLGKMLRYCLRIGHWAVPLREELAYVHAYIDLLNIRNDYTIGVDEFIPKELLDTKIPRMLIQPLVENVFFHVIEPRGEDAGLGISAEADSREGILWICVQDHGPGLSAEELEKIREEINGENGDDSSGSIGLKNIQRRLNVFYGPEWRLRIVSIPGQGTTVSVPVPLVSVKETQCSPL